MREDVITPVTARRLAAAGLAWDPQIGDWCTVMGGEHISEAQIGLWLVASLAPQPGLLGLADSAGRWPMSYVAARDCLWLPTLGKLKMWLRGHGYRVATGEAPVPLLGSSGSALRHVCRATRADVPTPIDGEGSTEAEAVADVILRLLGSQTADAPSRSW